MHLSHLVFLAGVLGVTAHPSGHAQFHRNAHKRDEPVFVKAVHKPIPVPEAKVSAAAVPAASPSAAAAATPSAAAQSSDNQGSDKFIPFCSDSSATKKVKRVTNAQIMYTGNLGTANGCPWNSNMMVVPNNIANKYKHVQTYTNVASTAYQVVCGNKMGADGLLTGMFKTDANKHLVFTLQPGETKTVVAESNTQAICAFAPGEVPTTTFGQFAGNWVEVDFDNTSNGGWSGADCSSLVAQAYNMDVPGCSVCSSGTCSDILPGGKGTNAYTKGMEALDGIGLNLAPGKVNLTVKVGFSG
ncbi:hypothetical protein B0T19DRAFT_22530 [Cercophora scortea]|uniref:Allergen Asp f 4 n=1 Tax=Cercophora scortea TaxID=314031 RepID=A0AAE0J3K1_9PEZI|nr:hypothetical protein B0T19DRAFT_22530 [Cercophora scortea]